MDEKGYIKFDCQWENGTPFPDSDIAQINAWRNKLHDLGLVGVYPNGIGFGNVSVRIPGSCMFIVSGSGTGNVERTSRSHFVKVTSWDFKENWLACEGPVKASSESLTHAAIYQSSPKVNAVVHVHNLALWKSLMGKVPTTGKAVECGTPEMAAEMLRLLAKTETMQKKILVMAGHEEGIISFGGTIGEAARVILHYFEMFKG